jgi:hypothetical protein
MIKQSYKTLKLDKELLLFPILSAICITSLLALGATFFLYDPLKELIQWNSMFYYSFFFLVYIGLIFSGVFFNSGLMYCAHIRINGKDPKFIDGIRRSRKNIFKLFQWALLSGTILVIIGIIRQSGLIGKIISHFMSALWSFATYLVLPVMIMEEKGVDDSLEKSVSLLKQTWSENIVGSLTFRAVYVVLNFVVFLPIAAISNSIHMASIILPIYIIGISVGYLLLFTLEEIFKVVLYNYAISGKTIEGYDEEFMKNAFYKI